MPSFLLISMQSCCFLSRPLQTFCICKSIFSPQRWHLRCVNNTFYFTQQSCEYLVDFSLRKLIVPSCLFMLRWAVLSSVWTPGFQTPSRASLWLWLEDCWCKLCFLTCLCMCINWMLCVRKSKRTQSGSWFLLVLLYLILFYNWSFCVSQKKGRSRSRHALHSTFAQSEMIHLIEPLTNFISSKVMLVCWLLLRFSAFLFTSLSLVSNIRTKFSTYPTFDTDSKQRERKFCPF